MGVPGEFMLGASAQELGIALPFSTENRVRDIFGY